MVMVLDSNNGYFPLVYGVVEKEYRDDWPYCFRVLRICLDGVDLSKYTFISDRQLVCLYGFIFALNAMLPNVIELQLTS